MTSDDSDVRVDVRAGILRWWRGDRWQCGPLPDTCVTCGASLAWALPPYEDEEVYLAAAFCPCGWGVALTTSEEGNPTFYGLERKEALQ
jgi:hypothetical protein